MLEQFAYLADIVGVILIVASLVYVARQLQQNTEMLRSNARQTLVTNDHVLVQTLLENVDILEKITKPEQLSFQDQWRFGLTWILTMRNREHEYFQYRAGVLDAESWESYRQQIPVTLSSERARKWWNSGIRALFSPEFARMVDEIISDAPAADFMTEFGTWD